MALSSKKQSGSWLVENQSADLNCINHPFDLQVFKSGFVFQ
jgi:hypothetical protein